MSEFDSMPEQLADTMPQVAHLPSFAAEIAWPASEHAKLQQLHCPPAIVAAMDGAVTAFDRLRTEDAGDASPAQRRMTSRQPEKAARHVVILARDCMDYSWEELHAGPW